MQGSMDTDGNTGPAIQSVPFHISLVSRVSAAQKDLVLFHSEENDGSNQLLLKHINKQFNLGNKPNSL